jgi:uncharacterized protein (DUF1330 family)
MSRLDITDETLDRFLAEDDGAPVVLVNLVRLRPDGAAAYREYGAAVAPLLAGVAAELIYAGEARGVLIGEETWDLAAVVRYPNRAALAQLVRNPAFAELTSLRHAALEAGILYAFS